MLNKKVIVITGAAGLIGKALIKTCLEYGAIVIATDVNEYALDQLLDHETFVGFRASLFCQKLDITDKFSIQKVIQKVVDQHGLIYAIVNNAYPRNAAFGKKLEDVNYDDFNENINLNVGGYFLVMQQFCIFFKRQGHGIILNMASIYGVIPPRFSVYDGTSMTMPVEYAAIKSSIINLTKYFAQYYKKTGIRINALSPGGVLDGQPDAFLSQYNDHCSSKGMLDPEDVAKAAAYLISEGAAYIQGQNFIIDDGYSL